MVYFFYTKTDLGTEKLKHDPGWMILDSATRLG